MNTIHNKVNIMPVIAKADTLTLEEHEWLKKRILDEIEEHNIKIYHLPDAESDEDEDFKEQTRLLKVITGYGDMNTSFSLLTVHALWRKDLGKSQLLEA